MAELVKGYAILVDNVGIMENTFRGKRLDAIRAYVDPEKHYFDYQLKKMLKTGLLKRIGARVVRVGLVAR